MGLCDVEPMTVKLTDGIEKKVCPLTELTTVGRRSVFASPRARGWTPGFGTRGLSSYTGDLYAEFSGSGAGGDFGSIGDDRRDIISRIAGFGDGASDGVTYILRELLDANGSIDFSSVQYAGCAAAGFTATSALAWSTGARVRIKSHKPHHSFPFVGRRPHVQITWWWKGIKGSDVHLRFLY